MNLRELEYVVALDEERNLSRASERLHITPSALTQQVIRIEKEIGISLFFRSRSGWCPTKAGEIYLSAARQILLLKRDAYKQLQDLAQRKQGTIAVGIPPERGSEMFSSIYPRFHHQFPDITIKLIESSVYTQQEMISSGKLDLGFMTLSDSQKTGDEYILICREEILVAVPDCYAVDDLIEKEGPVASAYPVISLSRLEKEPFAIMNQSSTLRKVQEDIFRQNQIQPVILFETARSNTILDMVAGQMCCALISEFYTHSSHAKNMRFFSMSDHPVWNVAACHRKGGYLSDAEKYLLRLAADYWNPGETDSCPVQKKKKQRNTGKVSVIK